MINTILFDLDGTLLLTDSDEFTAAYFAALVDFLAPLHQPEETTAAVWAGTKAMVKNDGSRPNAEVYWDTYRGIFGEGSRSDEERFAEFYRTRYKDLASLCGKHPHINEFIKTLKGQGYRLVVATNPLFPRFVIRERVSWTGADPDDFDWMTSYETSHYSKPNPNYYREILEQIHSVPEESLMVGNDVQEDMIAAETGMKVFLLTDHLRNKAGADISVYPRGNFDDLTAYITENGIGSGK